MTKLYAATVILRGVGQQRVTVMADDVFRAKAVLEAQHGRGNVQHVYVATESDRQRLCK